jgi:hypothetical protein
MVLFSAAALLVLLKRKLSEPNSNDSQYIGEDFLINQCVKDVHSIIKSMLEAMS